MLEIGLTILIIALVAGVASYLWRRAPFVEEPFKGVGNWIILVVAVIMIIVQVIKLIKLV